MSNLEEGEMMESLKSQGVLDQALEAMGFGSPPAPAPEADTEVEEPVAQVEEIVEEAPVEEAPEDVESIEELVAEVGEDVFLDLTPEVEQFLAKYDGDLNKALRAATEGQSLIGRQGSELGDLRKELQELKSLIEGQQSYAPPLPYQAWPDEDADAYEAVPQLRQIAEAAFQNDDGATFDRAMRAWDEQDPLGAETYRMLKATQVMALQQQQQTPQQPGAEAAMRDVVTRYPQVNEQAFQQEMDAEIAKLPSLGRVIRGEIPGVTEEERVAAFEELVSRVADRRNADTQQEARRRVAVRTSEQAKQARLEAQVASGGGVRPPIEEEPDDRVIPMGATGMGISEAATNAMLESVFGSHATVTDRQGR